jgi:hypothetical protein
MFEEYGTERLRVATSSYHPLETINPNHKKGFCRPNHGGINIYKCAIVHRILLLVANHGSINLISTEDTDYPTNSLRYALKRLARIFVAEEMLLLLRWL